MPGDFVLRRGVVDDFNEGLSDLISVEDNFVVWAVDKTSEIRLIKDELITNVLRNKKEIDLSKISGKVLFKS